VTASNDAAERDRIVAAVRHIKTRLDDAQAGNYGGDDIAELCDLGEQLGNAVRQARLRRTGRSTPGTQPIDAARIQAVVDAAITWRRMRVDTPTRPKPEAAALIAAVDALTTGDSR
jgi:hypothetical protein